MPDPIFTITIQKGLADRHRLPLDQVISVLSEVKQMLTDVGREIQKERGIEQKPMEFGLELVAGTDGGAFSKGSLRAKIAITRNAEIGAEAAARILETVHSLGLPKKPVRSEDSGTAKILNHLDNMAFLQTRSKAQAKFAVSVPRSIQPDVNTRKEATFGEEAVKKLATLREPLFKEGGVTLYGKLVELKDKTLVDREGGVFWGELRRDNGERWRVQFGDDLGQAEGLFRKQVRIEGEAHYFRTRNPKLIATSIEIDPFPDYEAAFNELSGIDKDLYAGHSLDAILDSRYS